MNATTDAEEGVEIVLFYGHSGTKPYREFSNFYIHKAPFKFELPHYAHKEGLPTYVWCEFSEKAIMATKAALMGDAEMFREIDGTTDPATCKQCGRKVKNFDENLWQKHLEDIAFEVVRQKFESEQALRQLLLKTGDRIIAEAAPNDRIWGIGLATTDIEARDPSKWQGRNILGEALMKARSALRGGDTAADTTKASSAKGKRRWGKAPGSAECTESSICTDPEAGAFPEENSSGSKAMLADDVQLGHGDS